MLLPSAFCALTVEVINGHREGRLNLTTRGGLFGQASDQRGDGDMGSIVAAGAVRRSATVRLIRLHAVGHHVLLTQGGLQVE
jgi:hypothetical protein